MKKIIFFLCMIAGLTALAVERSGTSPPVNKRLFNFGACISDVNMPVVLPALEQDPCSQPFSYSIRNFCGEFENISGVEAAKIRKTLFMAKGVVSTYKQEAIFVRYHGNSY